ncbi:hypothetical protein J6590_058784 [Homalodisca vitripennis]|nr:hypothetical protein J6590_058784 [Homalodisca vitripennis]
MVTAPAACDKGVSSRRETNSPGWFRWSLVIALSNKLSHSRSTIGRDDLPLETKPTCSNQ